MRNASMMPILLCVLAVCLLLAACSSRATGRVSNLSANETQPAARGLTSPITDPSFHSPSPDIASYPERKEAEEAEEAEKRKRKGEIQMDNIENAGVKGELLEAAMALLEAVKNKDEETKLKLHYDPSRLTFDAIVEPFIHAFTKIELDNTDLELMMDGYDFYSEAAIVKITAIRLDRQLNEHESTGNYIFVKIDGNWLVYRSY